MREMWQRHGKSEQPYHNEDVRAALAAVTGDSAFAGAFFEQYVYGSDLVDFRKLLSAAGLLLRPVDPGAASLGEVSLRFRDGKATIARATLIGTPLYQAGLDRGDEIVEIDGKTLDSHSNYDALLAAHKPGDTIEIKFQQRGQAREAQMTFIEAQALEIVPFEHAGMAVSAQIEQFREQWLGSKALTRLPAMHKYCHTCSREFAFRQQFCYFDGVELHITKKE